MYFKILQIWCFLGFLLRGGLQQGGSDALLTLVMGILQEVNIVAADGHAHECFSKGQLFKDFCTMEAPREEEV